MSNLNIIPATLNEGPDIAPPPSVEHPPARVIDALDSRTMSRLWIVRGGIEPRRSPSEPRRLSRLENKENDGRPHIGTRGAEHN